MLFELLFVSAKRLSYSSWEGNVHLYLDSKLAGVAEMAATVVPVQARAGDDDANKIR